MYTKLVNIEARFYFDSGLQIEKNVHNVREVNDESGFLQLNDEDNNISLNPRFINCFEVSHSSGVIAYTWCEEEHVADFINQIPALLEERLELELEMVAKQKDSLEQQKDNLEQLLLKAKEYTTTS
jgi:hypothetical protein